METCIPSLVQAIAIRATNDKKVRDNLIGISLGGLPDSVFRAIALFAPTRVWHHFIDEKSPAACDALLVSSRLYYWQQSKESSASFEYLEFGLSRARDLCFLDPPLDEWYPPIYTIDTSSTSLHAFAFGIYSVGASAPGKGGETQLDDEHNSPEFKQYIAPELWRLANFVRSLAAASCSLEHPGARHCTYPRRYAATGDDREDRGMPVGDKTKTSGPKASAKEGWKKPGKFRGSRASVGPGATAKPYGHTVGDAATRTQAAAAAATGTGTGGGGCTIARVYSDRKGEHRGACRAASPRSQARAKHHPKQPRLIVGSSRAGSMLLTESLGSSRVGLGRYGRKRQVIGGGSTRVTRCPPTAQPPPPPTVQVKGAAGPDGNGGSAPTKGKPRHGHTTRIGKSIGAPTGGTSLARRQALVRKIPSAGPGMLRGMGGRAVEPLLVVTPLSPSSGRGEGRGRKPQDAGARRGFKGPRRRAQQQPYHRRSRNARPRQDADGVPLTSRGARREGYSGSAPVAAAEPSKEHAAAAETISRFLRRASAGGRRLPALRRGLALATRLPALPAALEVIGIGHLVLPQVLRPAAALMGGLTHLSLRGCSALQRDAVPLIASSFPRLEVLDLCGCSGMGDRELLQIGASLPRLRVLEVAGWRRITGSGLAAFAEAVSVVPVGGWAHEEARGSADQGVSGDAAGGMGGLSRPDSAPEGAKCAVEVDKRAAEVEAAAMTKAVARASTAGGATEAMTKAVARASTAGVATEAASEAGVSPGYDCTPENTLRERGRAVGGEESEIAGAVVYATVDGPPTMRQVTFLPAVPAAFDRRRAPHGTSPKLTLGQRSLRTSALRCLNLADCRGVDDGGVAALGRRLPGLRDLCLYGCLQLTGRAADGFGHLDCRLRRLNTAGVYKWGQDATSYLLQANPGLLIYNNPNEFDGAAKMLEGEIWL